MLQLPLGQPAFEEGASVYAGGRVRLEEDNIAAMFAVRPTEESRGGMGVVYEAIQESLGRHVALKVLPHGALADPAALKRFRREARSVARLHHSNIVPVFGIGEHAGHHYYAMQLIRGQTLEAVLGGVRRLRDLTGPCRHCLRAGPNARRPRSPAAW